MLHNDPNNGEFMTLTTQDNFAVQLAEFDKIQTICKNLMQTPHYKKLGEEGIHVIMARAKALGIHPFEALNGGFHCIQGKVGMSTEMMAALIRQRGHSITKNPKSTPECVILNGKRKDNGDEWTCSFSKEDAIAAGLWGSATWKKYPQIMLYNRCMSMLFRQLFPDLSLGTGYVEDELKEITKTGDYAKSDKPEDMIPESVEEIEPPKKETISAEQRKVLLDLLEDTSDEYRDSVYATLKKFNPPITILGDLPSSLFIRVRDAAIKNQINSESDIQKDLIDEVLYEK